MLFLERSFNSWARKTRWSLFFQFLNLPLCPCINHIPILLTEVHFFHSYCKRGFVTSNIQYWYANYPFYNNHTWLSQIGDTEKISWVENMKSYSYGPLKTYWKKLRINKDVLICKYYYLLKVLQSSVCPLELKAF